MEIMNRVIAHGSLSHYNLVTSDKIIFITIYGKTKTIEEWSEITGIPPKTLRYRIVSN